MRLDELLLEELLRDEEPELFDDPLLLLRDPPLLALVDEPDELLRAVEAVRLAAVLPCDLAVDAVFLAAVEPLFAAVLAVLPAVDAALRALDRALLPEEPFDDELRDDEPRERDDEDELLRDDDERERDDDEDEDERSSFGISALTTSRVSFGICFATKSNMRCSSRRMPFAILDVSLSPTWSASSMIAV